NTKGFDNLNYTMKEFTDLRFPQLYPDHTVASIRQLIAPLLNRNQSKVSVCTWQKGKNGTSYPVELHVLRADSDSDLLAASCSDLSHRREEVKNHNQQKKRAERSARLSKQQGKLAANINHDLRTGLNSISLLSKALNK